MAISHAKQTTDFIELASAWAGWRGCNPYAPELLQSPGAGVAEIRHFRAAVRLRIYQELCPGVLRSGGTAPSDRRLTMTMSAPHAPEAVRPPRGLLPLWVGAGVYAVFILA